MLDQAFNSLQTFDWGNDVSVLKPINDAVVATHGDATARADLEQRLVAALTPAATRAAKDFLFRQLMIVGTAASVPVLAKFLLDHDLTHMARYALERIPAPEAAQALRESLQHLDGEARIGVITSLGVRRDAASVPLLAVALGDADIGVARSAAAALGSIRTLDAANVLSNAKTTDETIGAVTHALLSCAEGLLADGKKVAALGIYKRFAGENQPKHVRLAATRGMLTGVR